MPATKKSAKAQPQKLWFKAKLYGWGWYPCSKEGWAILGLFIVLIAIFASRIEQFQAMQNGMALYFTMIALVVCCLLAICYKTGEKPRWRWGK